MCHRIAHWKAKEDDPPIPPGKEIISYNIINIIVILSILLLIRIPPGKEIIMILLVLHNITVNKKLIL